MSEYLQHPVVISALKGALGGALVAAVIDYQAFRSWKSWWDLATYDWSTASWRWFQGAAVGALTALGITFTA